MDLCHTIITLSILLHITNRLCTRDWKRGISIPTQCCTLINETHCLEIKIPDGVIMNFASLFHYQALCLITQKLYNLVH